MVLMSDNWSPKIESCISRAENALLLGIPVSIRDPESCNRYEKVLPKGFRRMGISSWCMPSVIFRIIFDTGSRLPLDVLVDANSWCKTHKQGEKESQGFFCLSALCAHL